MNKLFKTGDAALLTDNEVNRILNSRRVIQFASVSDNQIDNRFIDCNLKIEEKRKTNLRNRKA